MNKIYLFMQLSQYKRTRSFYLKKRIGIKKLKLKHELESIRNVIIPLLNEENLSFEELFDILKKYEDSLKGEISFYIYRFYFKENNSKNKFFVDGIKFFFKTNDGIEDKILVMFSDFVYEENKDNIIDAKLINISEVIKPDLKKTLKKLYICMDHYEKIIDNVIMYLIKKNNI